MRFLMMVKASPNSEAGMMPDEKMIATMMQYNEELQKAGVLIDLAGLQPSSAGARIKFSGGKHTVVEGPFANPEGLVAGYWLIRVNSKQEAIGWARRCPPPHGPGADAEIELRQLFELDDFEPSKSIDAARRLEQDLARENQR
ncbi:MAG: YciI family protein [Stellaceae bacterium]